MSLLKVENLNASYGDVQILHGVSLDVNRGELVSIVGANAAGKSTLLRALSGLLKKVSGSILFKEEELTKMPAYTIAERGLVHVPEGRRVFPLLSVQENLEIGAYTQRSKGNMKVKLEKVYEIFPALADHKGQAAGSLSGGEQQMLAIARGLMAEPVLLMIDEPSLGLAPILVEKTFQILREIKKEGVTILLVEQNVVKALELSDRAYVLENGRVTLEGNGSDLLGDPHLKRAYMGL
jgi:branched-chain amino acid transport system ATP-binding protein